MDYGANLQAINRRMEAACSRVGRNPASVELLAVTKGHPPEAIQTVAAAGHRLFGENRVQEAKAKIPQCPGNLRWHMIGHLQSNKSRDAVHWFEMVQSVDSLDLARELDRWAGKSARTLPILLEVNVAGEATKFGFQPEQLFEQLLVINQLPRLAIHGLMAVPPWTPVPEKSRVYFRRLREYQRRCEEILGAPLPQLSMGMSGDFEVAIEEGATIVRVGTGIFGERPRAGKAPRSESGAEEGP